MRHASTADAADEELLSSVARGDHASFAILVERYQTRFFRVAARTLGDDRDAQDCVQIAFFRIYRKAADYRPELPAAPWLYRVLSNACIDTWRRRRREVSMSEPVRDGNTLSPDSLRLDLAAALARLPAQMRIVLLLFALEGLSHAEIASVRGVSVNTVKTQLARARKVLRPLLAEGIR